MNYIYELPEDIINIIKEYLPKNMFVFTDRENYHLYHSCIKSYIRDYESYIRAMIRQDNDFVFSKIVQENCYSWYQIRQYQYKNMIFTNYLYFVIYFCIENESNNCRKILSKFLKEHGLAKNLYKKKVVKYIRWKN